MLPLPKPSCLSIHQHYGYGCQPTRKPGPSRLPSSRIPQMGTIKQIRAREQRNGEFDGCIFICHTTCSSKPANSYATRPTLQRPRIRCRPPTSHSDSLYPTLFAPCHAILARSRTMQTHQLRRCDAITGLARAWQTCREIDQTPALMYQKLNHNDFSIRSSVPLKETTTVGGC